LAILGAKEQRHKGAKKLSNFECRFESTNWFCHRGEANQKAKIKEQKYKAKCKNSGGGQ